MTINTIRIATRKSPMALYQAQLIQQQLQALEPDCQFQLVPMSTLGDRNLTTNLAKIGGKGVFVKELEQAMLEHRADIAVHSMKDVPLFFPEDLTIAVVNPRDTPKDALVSSTVSDYRELAPGSVIGTSSLRRICQLKALRPDCQLVPLRGNVQTRLAKLDAGDYDAVILAASGLQRVGLAQRITQQFDVNDMLPAAGQGALGVEYRAGDKDIAALVQRLVDPDTSITVTAERAVTKRLGGNCQVPIAAFATIDQHGVINCEARVFCPDTFKQFRVVQQGKQAQALGTQVAEALLAQGADKILRKLGLID